ncbi:alpha/beta fold hydrolase [Planctomicrobium piriforme]|uniref:Alpha/beta hydrolase family protein n=1 Tax=Planctomicrobium piriforme TaxID=1576369 RepID=A0A1I3SAS1_9PLAN|nr:alpha/beta fold hydrolase [Planctomicrobium piriforme]SFJ54641.1 Alpha/beta hydrolase family protein [Planctomicrobium piriforme]
MEKTIKVLTEERLRQGYVIVLPGIEGASWINRRIVRGLLAADVPYAMEIHDWTYNWPLMLYNLRSRRLHTAQATELREKILDYQSRYPNRPVYLIGHSGGGGMTLETLAGLPQGTSIAGAVLLGAAMSPGYDFRVALQHVDRKIWNFSSWGDFLFLGLFTTVAGTIDGRMSPCAGMLGFNCQQLTNEERGKYEEMPYRLEYCRDLHLAGHFGFTAPRFIRNWVAPLLMACPTAAEALTDEATERLSRRIVNVSVI